MLAPPFKPLLVVAGALAAATAGISFYAARRMEHGALRVNHRQPPYDAVVLEVREGAVLLASVDPRRPARDLRHPGQFGLRWDGGHAHLGHPNDHDGTAAWRPVLAGTAPPPGTPVRLDSFVHHGDPAAALTLHHDTVDIETELGPMPAWLVPGGDGSRWTIAVHGKGASPAEFLRTLPALHEAGQTLLAIHYRNDAGVPASPSGCYQFGCDEWRDLEAAVAFARTRGASDITLFGCSMGGSISLSFMRNSRHAHAVRRLVLDAPMLDLRQTIAANAPRVPSPIMGLGAAVLAARRRVDWAAVHHLAHEDWLDVPILLFHGERDTLVPVATSDQFARIHPDVEYIRTDSAGHVRSWNASPEMYNAALIRFLQR